MRISPNIKIAKAHELDHGSVVLLADGHIGIVWRVIRRPGVAGSNFVVDLVSFETKDAHSVALLQQYIPHVADTLKIVPRIESIVHEARLISAGDLFFTAYPEGLETEVFLAVSDPYESQLVGISLTDAPNVVQPNQGYVIAFRDWDLCVGEGTEMIRLVSRTRA